MNIRDRLLRFHWVLSTQFSINPRLVVNSIRGLPRYIRDYIRFRSGYTGRLEWTPCLNDWYEEGGTTNTEYFWQDLLVSRMIFEAKPEKHVDIGSRLDGFIAQVASFREIEMFEIRPITARIPHVTILQTDFMEPIGGMEGYCDSISCLHALEHFGLGRYGDPINPSGYRQGLVNMAHLLREGGVLYLSVPIGIDRVEFNAHRIFDPRQVVNLARENLLRLIGLTVIRPGGRVEALALDESQLFDLASQRYVLGIFTFLKNAKAPKG